MTREKRTTRKRQKEKKSMAERIREILSWIFEIVTVILFAFVLVFFFGQIRTNIGQAMEMTLSDGDHVLMDTFLIVWEHQREMILLHLNQTEVTSLILI